MDSAALTSLFYTISNERLKLMGRVACSLGPRTIEALSAASIDARRGGMHWYTFIVWRVSWPHCVLGNGARFPVRGTGALDPLLNAGRWAS